MRNVNGKCLIAKPDEEIGSKENIAWDEESDCRLKEQGAIKYQSCDYFSEDPYSKILCNKGMKR